MDDTNTHTHSVCKYLFVCGGGVGSFALMSLLSSHQDELPKTAKKFNTHGLGISGVKARSASSKNSLPVPVADVHSRQPTWVAQSRTSSAKSTDIFSRRGSSASSARRGSSAGSDGIPAKLQNLFQVSNKAPRDIPAVRAESDLLAFQTYAPNWKPKQKVSEDTVCPTFSHCDPHFTTCLSSCLFVCLHCTDHLLAGNRCEN